MLPEVRHKLIFTALLGYYYLFRPCFWHVGKRGPDSHFGEVNNYFQKSSNEAASEKDWKSWAVILVVSIGKLHIP